MSSLSNMMASSTGLMTSFPSLVLMPTGIYSHNPTTRVQAVTSHTYAQTRLAHMTYRVREMPVQVIEPLPNHGRPSAEVKLVAFKPQEHLVRISEAFLACALDHEAADNIVRHNCLHEALADDLDQAFVVNVA